MGIFSVVLFLICVYTLILNVSIIAIGTLRNDLSKKEKVSITLATIPVITLGIITIGFIFSGVLYG